MEVGGWLRSLGLGKYEAAFRENEIDETVLPNWMDVRLIEWRIVDHLNFVSLVNLDCSSHRMPCNV
jgi:hypothetical protein